MSKRKHSKPTKAVLIDTGEDAVNINLGRSLDYHIPFDCLKKYYDGGIHRPPHKVGDLAESKRVGHEIFSIVGMFEKPGEPFSLEGTWLNDGVFIGQYHYDCREVLGGHIRGGITDEQEFVVTSVESVNGSRPYANSIRNFTKMTDFKLPMSGEHQVARAHGWRAKIGVNLPKVEHSFSDPGVPKTIIYAGSGPSLRHNYAELLKLDRSKTGVWATNEAFCFLAWHGVPVDFFFCMDSTSPDRWWKDIDCSETCLVAAPFVNPAILNGNWKKVYWFNIAGNGFYYNMIRQARPHLLEVDATKGIGSALIESTWPKGVRRIVMIGCDFCYEVDEPNRIVWRHVASPMNPDEWKKMYTNYAHMLAFNHKGQMVPTYIGLALEAASVFGAAECLWEQGVRVINATEGGCLRANPHALYLNKYVEKVGRPVIEDMKLEDAVRLVNANPL